MLFTMMPLPGEQRFICKSFNVSKKAERYTTTSIHLLFTWTTVWSEMIAGETTGARFAGVIALSAFGHCRTPRRSVSVLTIWRTYITSRVNACINASYTVKGWRMVYGRDQVIKIKVWTRYSAAYMRLVISSALQSRKRQQIGMSQRCRSALCGHPLRALMDNWTHGAASRHTIAPISHTRSSPRSRSYYSFPVPLRVGGWVGLSTQ